MELERSMYVRTKYGIAKILSTNYTDDIVENFLVVDKELEVGLISGCDCFLCDKEDVTKASSNIIDLIEVGDIITTNNLCGEITKIDKGNNKIYLACSDYCSVEDIKSIVTKEQFERESYKVGE